MSGHRSGATTYSRALFATAEPVSSLCPEEQSTSRRLCHAVTLVWYNTGVITILVIINTDPLRKASTRHSLALFPNYLTPAIHNHPAFFQSRKKLLRKEVKGTKRSAPRCGRTGIGKPKVQTQSDNEEHQNTISSIQNSSKMASVNRMKLVDLIEEYCFIYVFVF